VSKNDNCHCTGTKKLWWKPWEGSPEEESLEATSENGHRGCGRDMLGQTVPSMGSSNREGPITDDGQPCTTEVQRQRGSRSKASPGLLVAIWGQFLIQQLANKRTKIR